jgi:hypothetical protein
MSHQNSKRRIGERLLPSDTLGHMILMWERPSFCQKQMYAIEVTPFTVPPHVTNFCMNMSRTQSGEVYTKIGTSPTFCKTVRIFFFSLGNHRKPVFSSRLNSENYFCLSAIFLVSKFYLGIFLKLRIVSRIFFIYNMKLVLCF